MNSTKLIILLSISLSFTILEIASAQSSSTIGRYDIIFSEIMADPTPAIGLPEVEFVELHNRTGTRQEMSGWKLKIGNTEKALPSFAIDSGGYIVIIAQKFQQDFVNICPNLILLSSLSLTDGGQTLILYDANGEIIDRVSYKPSWHTDVIKRNGGWSLELKDPSFPCLGRVNWDSSIDPSGGTPGRPNANSCPLADNDVPILERLSLVDSLTLRLWFSEPLLFEDTPAPSLFDIQPSIGISFISEVPPSFNAVDLHLARPPTPGTYYTVTINGILPDCAGNTASVGCFLRFGRTQSPLQQDLVINEVLSHPFDGSDAEFIEIYNRSNKIIDLKEVKIGAGGISLPEKAVVSVSGGMQLFPGCYCALCKEKTSTLKQYYCPDPTALIQCDSLPTYANTQGIVWLTNHFLGAIDRLAYNDEMHYSSLTSTEGVSLERLRADAPTQDISNWHSAATSVGYATPGYRNSQAENAAPSDSIDLQPDIFSPDNDGIDDFTEITIAFTDHDNRLTITICDAQGHPVCHLANNDLCGLTARYRWDGVDDQRNKLPRGQYLVIIRWWNSNGRSRTQRKVVGLW